MQKDVHVKFSFPVATGTFIRIYHTLGLLLKEKSPTVHNRSCTMHFQIIKHKNN